MTTIAQDMPTVPSRRATDQFGRPMIAVVDVRRGGPSDTRVLEWEALQVAMQFAQHGIAVVRPCGVASCAPTAAPKRVRDVGASVPASVTTVAAGSVTPSPDLQDSPALAQRMREARAVVTALGDVLPSSALEHLATARARMADVVEAPLTGARPSPPKLW